MINILRIIGATYVLWLIFGLMYWIYKIFCKILTIIFWFFKIRFPFSINNYLQLFIFLIFLTGFGFLANNNYYLVLQYKLNSNLPVVLFFVSFIFFYSLFDLKILRSEFLTNLFNQKRKWCD